MKLGYSLLLGEYINSDCINHDDCKSFQIVCPSCKEPIFKVVRETHGTHYLSHYEKGKAYEADCELRVGNISREEVEKVNSDSKGQRLKYFLEVLRTAILDAAFSNEAESVKAENFAKRIRKSNALRKYREFAVSQSRHSYQALPGDEIARCFEGYIDDVTEISGEFPATSFALATQKRIAQDVWLHLLSANAHENYMFLWGHAYSLFLTRLEISDKERGSYEYERILHKAMRRMPETNSDEVDAILRELARKDIGAPFAREGSNLFRKMTAEIEHEMLGILLQLRYFEMLRDARTNSFSS